MLVATPLGLGALPSVTLGYFAISFVTPNLLTPLLGGDTVSFFNLAACGICVGILTLPLVASVSEDAMRAVPQASREAAYGLGELSPEVEAYLTGNAGTVGLAFVYGGDAAIAAPVRDAIQAAISG